MVRTAEKKIYIFNLLTYFNVCNLRDSLYNHLGHMLSDWFVYTLYTAHIKVQKNLHLQKDVLLSLNFSSGNPTTLFSKGKYVLLYWSVLICIYNHRHTVNESEIVSVINNLNLSKAKDAYEDTRRVMWSVKCWEHLIGGDIHCMVKHFACCCFTMGLSSLAFSYWFAL